MGQYIPKAVALQNPNAHPNTVILSHGIDFLKDFVVVGYEGSELLLEHGTGGGKAQGVLAPKKELDPKLILHRRDLTP